MKRIFFVCTLLCFAAASHAAEKKDPMAVEMIEGPTNRPHSIISPVSADKKNTQDAFNELRKNAAKLDADAVIEYQCLAGGSSKQTGMGTAPGFWGFMGNKNKVNSICQGKAIKWTGPATATLPAALPAELGKEEGKGPENEPEKK